MDNVRYRVGQIINIGNIGDVPGLVGNLAGTVELVVTSGERVGQYFAEIARTSVGGVVWSRPEWNGLRGRGTDGKVLLNEELIFAGVDLVEVRDAEVFLVTDDSK